MSAPVETSWDAMCRSPEKYMPLIVRVAGYYLAFCDRDDEQRTLDFPGIESAASKIPALQSLTDDELDFVHYAAAAAHFEGNIDYEVREMVRSWIEGGATI